MNRDELITALQQSAAQKPRAVFVKGWGQVYIRALTVGEVEEQTEDTTDKTNKHRLARAAARLLCDESGHRLLDPDKEEDVALLSLQPWKMLRLILNESDDLKEEPAGN